jgi:hypothetical protein
VNVFADSEYSNGCANMLSIFCASSTHGRDCPGRINDLLGDPKRGKVLGYQQFKTVIYMVISLSAFFTIYAARTRGPFIERRPGGFLAAASLVAVSLTTVVAAAVSQDSSLGMQPIGHTLGIVWAYVIIWFLFEDLVMKSICFSILAKLNVQEDITAAHTALRKAASTKQGDNEKAVRKSVIEAGEVLDAGRVNSLINASDLGQPPKGAAQPASRLRSVEMKVDKLQGALLRKRVIDNTDIA